MTKYDNLLRISIILMILVILIVPFFLVRMYKNLRLLAQDQFNEQQMLASKQTALSVENDIDLLSRELELLSQSSDVRSLNVKDAREIMDQNYERIKKMYISDMILINSQGKAVITILTPLLEGKNFSYRHYFKKAKESTTAEPIYEFITFQGTQYGQRGLGLVIAIPFFSNQQEFMGVLAFIVKIKELVESVIPLEMRKHRFWIVDSNLKVLYHPTYQLGTNIDAVADIDNTFKTFLAKIKSANVYRGDYYSRSGVHMIAASSPMRIGGKMWSVVIDAPADNMNNRLRVFPRRQIFAILFLIIITMGLSVLIIYFYYKKITLTLKETNDALIIENEGRKKIQRALEESEERYRQVVNNIGVGIAIINPKMEIMALNNQMKKWFPDVNVAERPLCYRIFNTQPRSNVCSSCPVTKTLKDGNVYETIIDMPKGSGVKHYRIVSTPIKDKLNNITAAIEMVEDVTESKEAELKMNEAFELKKDFIALVSHELRTPITIIKEGIEIVLTYSSESVNEKQKKFLNMAKHSVERLAVLINNVLDFQKLESGKMIFYKYSNDINEVIEELKPQAIINLGNKKIDFVTDLDHSLTNFRFDRDKIVQVLTNLIKNAIDFTEKGTIKISTIKEGDYVHVKVQDTGIGIKKEDAEKIFYKFEQVSRGDQRKTGGSGLGLAICKEIIEQHDGKIWVESKIGEGSTIHFTLPLLI